MKKNHFIYQLLLFFAIQITITSCSSEEEILEMEQSIAYNTDSYSDAEVLKLYEERLAAINLKVNDKESFRKVVGGEMSFEFLESLSSEQQLNVLFSQSENKLHYYKAKADQKYPPNEVETFENECLDYLIETTSADDVLKIMEFGTKYFECSDTSQKPKIVMSYCSHRPKIIQNIMIDGAVQIDLIKPVAIEGIGGAYGYCEKQLLHEIEHDLIMKTATGLFFEAVGWSVCPELGFIMNGLSIIKFVDQLMRYHNCKLTHLNSAEGIMP